MQRFPWKRNHGSEQPLRIVTYQVESREKNVDDTPGLTSHSFRVLVAHRWRRQGLNWRHMERVAFNSPGPWWDWLYSHCRPREPTWVYSHGAAVAFALADGWGQFDHDSLTTLSSGREYRDRSTGLMRRAADWHGLLAVDGLPWIVIAKCDRGTLKFVDVNNYVQASTAKLHKWARLAELPRPERDDDDGCWLSRCQQRVDSLDHTLFKLLNLWTGRYLGTWQPTMGGLSFSSFRHTSPDSGIVAHGCEPATAEEIAPFWIAKEPLPLDALSVSRMERRAYYGGRVAVGYVGDVTPDGLPPKWFGVDHLALERPCLTGPVTALDVNGLFPYAMRAGSFPVELMTAWELTDVDRLQRLVNAHSAVADVELWSPETEYPCKIGGRVAFVRGRIKTTLATPELTVALIAGHVKRVFAAAFYVNGSPFKEYVDYWWGKRLDAIQEGDTLTASLCKGMLVALYGKLGQRRPSWEAVTDVVAPLRWGPFVTNDPDGGRFRKYRSISGAVQREGERLDCRHTCTFLAASVTSWARCTMNILRQEAGRFNWLYQDTDSLFVLPKGLDNLVDAKRCDPTALGMLKVQATYETLSIFGGKDYKANGADTVSGLKDNATPDGERAWRQRKWEHSSAIIARTPDGTVESWDERFLPGERSAFISVDMSGWATPIRI